MQHEWKHRLLLVFADSDSSNKYNEQIKEFTDHEGGLQDRDLKMFRLFAQGQFCFGDQPLSIAATRALYRKYETEEGNFAVILIGKDGTEKLRTSEVLKLEKLFSVIDAMPMRQREMRQRQ